MDMNVGAVICQCTAEVERHGRPEQHTIMY